MVPGGFGSAFTVFARTAARGTRKPHINASGHCVLRADGKTDGRASRTE